MSKQNEPMTKERLIATGAPVINQSDGTNHIAVYLDDALAHGDERYEAGRAEGARQARVLVICKPCESGTHYHTEGQVGHLICDCGCWWPLKQRVLYSR